MQLNDIIHSRH